MKLTNLLGIMNAEGKVAIMHHSTGELAFKKIFEGEIWKAMDEMRYEGLEVIEAFIGERKEIVIYTK